MNATELLTPDLKPSGVWVCGTCRKVQAVTLLGELLGNVRDKDAEFKSAHARSQAEKCCEQPVCKCGKPRDRYRTICDDCSRQREQEAERRRFEAAEKVEYDGGMVMTPGDTFFSDLDALEDHYADADPEDGTKPEYVWLTKPVKFALDLSGDLLDRVHDRMHEDAADQFDAAALKELDEFGKAWWAKHGVASYEPDFTRCVLLTHEARQ